MYTESLATILSDTPNEHTASLVSARARVEHRITNTVKRLLAQTTLEADLINLSAFEDIQVLSILLLDTLEGTSLPADRRMRMAIKGAERFNQLVLAGGGVYGVDDVCLLLSRTRSAVLKMASRRQLIGFKREGQWVFLSGQFAEGGLIDGVREVLDEFPDDVDDETIVQFFLSGYESSDESPLGLLKKGISKQSLMQSAATYLEHGAR